MIWKLLKYFKVWEKWGDPDAMSPVYLLLLERIRERLPEHCSIEIHCAADTSGHSEKSQHYKRPCGVSDFHINGISFSRAIELIEGILKELDVFDYVGLGIYPDWNNPGFHLDTRGEKARWGYIGRSQVAYDLAREKAFKP
jgi:hypothetical protein